MPAAMLETGCGGFPGPKPSRRSAERRAHRSQGARRALNRRGTTTRNTRLSALRHPLGGGSKRKDTRGAASAAGKESCGGIRVPRKRHPRTTLFDIVNRDSTALPETSRPRADGACVSPAPSVQRARVDRRSEAEAGGVGVVGVARGVSDNNDPHPQPLPTRGRGADRVRGAFVRQTRSSTQTRGRHDNGESSRGLTASARRAAQRPDARSRPAPTGEAPPR